MGSTGSGNRRILQMMLLTGPNAAQLFVVTSNRVGCRRVMLTLQGLGTFWSQRTAQWRSIQ